MSLASSSSDRPWKDEWGATWLSDDAYTKALDAWVRRRMIAHHDAAERGAVHESVGPWTIDALVSDVHRHATAGRWLWATTAICFAQELLFCINDGGVDMSRHLGNFTDEVKTLRYLRNVIAHPANMPAKASTKADEKAEHSADEFCYRMERDPEFWKFAADLHGNWSLFADHRVTRFALRRLNTAGRSYVRQLLAAGGIEPPARP
jgi:hypothetical protein